MRDVHRVVLAKVHEISIHMKVDCVDILEKVKKKAQGKIKRGYIIKPLAITIIPDRTISVK